MFRLSGQHRVPFPIFSVRTKLVSQAFVWDSSHDALDVVMPKKARCDVKSYKMFLKIHLMLGNFQYSMIKCEGTQILVKLSAKNWKDKIDDITSLLWTCIRSSCFSFVSYVPTTLLLSVTVQSGRPRPFYPTSGCIGSILVCSVVLKGNAIVGLSFFFGLKWSNHTNKSYELVGGIHYQNWSHITLVNLFFRHF